MNTYLLRRGGLLIAVLLVAALFIGCGDNEDTGAEKAKDAAGSVAEATADVATALTAAEEEFVARIATISTAVDQAPVAAASVLEKFGMTAEEYEAAIYKIASNPALSDAFEKAKAR